MSGKNIEPNLHNTKKNRLPALSKPNEEIQLDFIWPITEKSQRFLIVVAMDRYSKWPAASLCKTTDPNNTRPYSISPQSNGPKYVGVKSVQYLKMGHAPRLTAEEPNDWDLGNAVRESMKNFSTDLLLLMTETTNDPTLLKTFVCLERKQQDNIPEKYQRSRKKSSTRYGLVFYGDRIIVPKDLKTTAISLLQKGHPTINKMSMAARHFWWPKITEAIQKKCDGCIPCRMCRKNIEPNLHNTEKNNYRH